MNTKTDWNPKVDWTMVALVFSAALILLAGSHFTVGNPFGSPTDFSSESDDIPVLPVTMSTSKLPGDAKAGPASFFQDSDGVIKAQADGTINLDSTTGKPFRLIGQVWLEGPSPTLLSR
jgi:hypothetical protein